MSSLGYAWDAVTSPYAAYWFATGILAACVILGTLTWACLGWDRRRQAARAKAEAPDYGHLTPREQFQWRHLAGAYKLPSAVFEEDDAESPARPAEPPVWRRVLAGIFGAAPPELADDEFEAEPW